ncbi:ATP-binding cassette domain-containing protein [Lacticaseibacillus nasuensis]|uniref:ATP-binding cassette domain-containing protein n=1 Tax=Lacticaseibacillus nasuensis TaxID=944671 RepID=UPI000A72C968|nr:ATP-binding cassette domain-containing protein [Lacticaseibacillus nasuensis]
MQLTVNQLSKTIAGASVLRNVNFTWQPGEIVGLVGRNGAGKTSLMRTMMNQYLPDAGSVAIDGMMFAEQPAARQQLIYIDPANLFFKRYSLRHIADFYAIGYPALTAHGMKPCWSIMTWRRRNNFAPCPRAIKPLWCWR